jgi:hypothetical protein
MRGRKVLLLMDNFSGHELGVELIGGLEGLSVCFYLRQTCVLVHVVC